MQKDGHWDSLWGPWANEQETQSFSYWSFNHNNQDKTSSYSCPVKQKTLYFPSGSTKVNDLKLMPYVQYQCSLIKTLQITRKSYKIHVGKFSEHSFTQIIISLHSGSKPTILPVPDFLWTLLACWDSCLVVFFFPSLLPCISFCIKLTKAA